MNASQFANIIKARFWLVFFTLVITVTTSVIATMKLPKKYTASTVLIIDFSEPVDGKLMPFQMTSSYLATQIDVIQSHNVAKKVVLNLKMYEDESAKMDFLEKAEGQGDIKDWLAYVLLEDIEVKPSRESSALIISYTASEADTAALIANAFAHAYGEANLELSVEPAKRTALWFSEQLIELRKNVEIASKKVSDYQQKHGIFAADERLDIETARLNEVSSQLVKAEAATRIAESNKNELDKLITNSESLESISEVQNNEFIQKIKIQLLDKEAKLLELSNQYGTKHPKYIRARKEVGSSRVKLRREIEKISHSVNNTLQLAESTEQALRGDLRDQREKVMSLKQSRNELPLLERELNSSQQIYELSLQRMNDNNLQSHMTTANISILTPAIAPFKASWPKLKLNIILSLFLGGFLGLGLAFIRELMDRRIRSGDDLTEGLGLNLLGTLDKVVA